MYELSGSLGQTIIAALEAVGRGEWVLLQGISTVMVACPLFFALYVQASVIAMIFMAHMLHQRYLQRQNPPPLPQIAISAVPQPPQPPDRTVQNAVGYGILIVLAVLVVMSSAH